MAQTVFVTGGTGFVGHELLRQLTAAGHSVRCLVRSGSEGKLEPLPQLEVVFGDATDPASLQGKLAGCDAVIHLVGIIREFPRRGITFERLHVAATENMLAAAQAGGVRRYLQMSANGADPQAKRGSYAETKGRAEAAVRDSGLDFTIFRPSLIYGKNGEFVTLLSDFVSRLPLVPVIGDGQYRLQPVAVEQVAQSFVAALDLAATVGQTYCLAGAQSYSYDALLDLVGKALGKKSVAKLHQPLFLMHAAATLFESIPAFPVTSGQIAMLTAGNVCDPAAWAAAFGLQPEDFADGIGRCLKR